MQVTSDAQADATYIQLTAMELRPGRRTVECASPPGVVDGSVLLDWKDGKLAGLEVLNASKLLHADLLAQSIPPPTV